MRQTRRHCEAFGLLLAIAPLWVQPLLAQPGAPSRFSVAIVRPAPAPSPNGFHWSFNIEAQRFTATNVTVAQLFREAYSLKDYQLVAPESWMNTNIYDVQAKADQASTPEQIHVMLQALLAEKFHLRFHTDTKTVAVMAIVEGKDGAKLRPPAPIEESDYFAPGERPARTMEAGQLALLKMATLDNLAELLSGKCSSAGRSPVINATGISGEFDLRTHTEPHPGFDGTMFGPICDALPQLGLKLEKRRVPVTTYYIDSAARQPDED